MKSSAVQTTPSIINGYPFRYPGPDPSNNGTDRRSNGGEQARHITLIDALNMASRATTTNNNQSNTFTHPNNSVSSCRNLNSEELRRMHNAMLQFLLEEALRMTYDDDEEDDF